jgi:hypothetical protein
MMLFWVKTLSSLRQHTSTKSWLLPASAHVALTQKDIITIVTAAKHVNLTFELLSEELIRTAVMQKIVLMKMAVFWDSVPAM